MILLVIGTIWVLYSVYIVLWRLYLSPLSKFPGPKLAAATILYEAYFDVVKGGQYIWEIQRMHEKYGPVVRISPDELHFMDPDFLDTIYASRNHYRNKYVWHVGNIPHTLMGSVDHEEHRQRRTVYAPFFNKTSIRQLEPLIAYKCDALVERLRKIAKSSETFNFTYAVWAFACDTVSLICFGDDWKHVDLPDFGSGFVEAAVANIKMFKILTHVKWIFPIVERVPHNVLAMIVPKIAQGLAYRPRLKAAVSKMLGSPHDTRSYAAGDKKTSKHGATNILGFVRADRSSPAHLKDFTTLARDSEILIGAGMGTTGTVIVGTFTYLHLDPVRLQLVRSELDAHAIALGKATEQLTWAELDGLPYFTACIKEGLRLNPGLTKRSPRIAPREGLQYGEYTIPAGTPMSTIAPLLHANTALFPQPSEFIPERWLAQPWDGTAHLPSREPGVDLGVPYRSCDLKYLESKIMSFSRGSRSCLGVELAWAEMYVSLAAILRAFEFQLVDTDKGDVEMVADLVMAEYKPGSKGTQARITKCRDVDFDLEPFRRMDVEV